MRCSPARRVPLLLLTMACGPEAERPDRPASAPPPAGLAGATPLAPRLPDHRVDALPALAPPGQPACPGSGNHAFEDVSDCAGLADARHIVDADPDIIARFATGQAWLDLDGDSWLDLVTTSPNGWSRAWLGSRTGAFVDHPAPALDGVPAFGAVSADVDGDGWRDLFLAGRTDRLLHSDGTGLTDFGGPDDPRNTLHGAFADLDGDGLPELFAPSYDCRDCTPELDTCPQTRDLLWSATDGPWRERTEEAFGTTGSPTCGMAFAGLFADYDNDGDLDLYVANDKGEPDPMPAGDFVRRNTYWRNDGPGCAPTCFTEQALVNGTAAYTDTMGIDAADFDNDGDLDLILTDLVHPTLLVNEGGGMFSDQTASRGLDLPLEDYSWGVVWLDFDNDADLDLYLAMTGPDRLYRNDAGQFVDLGDTDLAPATGETRGIARADYDRDGQIDLIVGDAGGHYRLLRNTTDTDHHWLGLRLVGEGPGGTDALGARVWVTDDSGRVQLREVHSGSANGGGSDLGLHFGLGASRPVEVRVRWPDGVQHSLDVRVDRWTEVIRAEL